LSVFLALLALQEGFRALPLDFAVLAQNGRLTPPPPPPPADYEQRESSMRKVHISFITLAQVY
jgi:hypothetical protein